mmetsp:Transcript_48956/g.116568  ORF Transcript_48956/g.116568 Transcript_48956/m.116568 type:complete len:1531 (+) Transcript_48956:112-4704(+)
MELFMPSSPSTPPRTSAPGLHIIDKVHERVQQATVFGIGLGLEAQPPHAVQEVRDLRTIDGRSLADTVQATHLLCSIDGKPIAERLAPGLPIESVIFGREGSIIRLGFTSKDGSRPYEVEALRHLKVNPTRERRRTLVAVSKHAVARGITAAPEIVAALERVRGSVQDEFGNAIDLIQDSTSPFRALGFAIQMKDGAVTGSKVVVASVDRGGPAHGIIEVGDHVLSVNGDATTPQTLNCMLAECNFAGRSVRLGLSRHGTAITQELRFDSSSCSDDFVPLMTSLKEIAGAGGLNQQVTRAAETLMHKAVEMRGWRRSAEARMARSTDALRAKVVAAVDEAESMLSIPKKHPDHIQADTRVEELQRLLKNSKVENDSLVKQLRDLNRWCVKLTEAEHFSKLRQAELERSLEGAEFQLKDLHESHKATVARLEAKISKMVPTVELRQSEDKRRQLEGDLERTRQMLSKDLVPIAHHAEAVQRARNLEEEVVRLKAQLAGEQCYLGLMAEHQTLKTHADKLAKELQSLKERYAERVPRAELLQAQGELKAARAITDSLNAQLDESKTLQQYNDLKKARAILLEDLKTSHATTQEALDRVAALQQQYAQQMPLAESTRLIDEIEGALEKVARLETQTQVLRDAAAATKGTMRDLKAKNDEAAVRMATLVDPADAAKARAGERAATSQSIEAVDLLNAEKKQAAKAREGLKVLVAELDALKLQVRDRVPAAEMEAAIAAVRAAKDEASRSKQEVETLSAAGEKLRNEAARGREELGRARAQLADKVPREALLAAQAEARVSKEQADLRFREFLDAEKRIVDAIGEAARLRAEFDKLNAGMEGIKDKALAEVGAAKDAVLEQKDALRLSMEERKLIETLNISLGEECAARKVEVGRLLAQIKDLVPRGELLQAVSEAQKQKERAVGLADEIRALVAERDALAKQNKIYEGRLEGADTYLANSLATHVVTSIKAELLVAQTELLALKEKLEAANQARGKADARCSDATAAFEQLKAHGALLRPRAEVEEANGRMKQAQEARAAGDVARALADATVAKASEELARVRKELHLVMEEKGGMVPTERLVAASAREKALEQQLDVAKRDLKSREAEVAALAKKLSSMVPAALLTAAREEVEQLRGRLATLNAELADAGLAHPAARATLFKALAGPPAMEAAGVAALLDAVRNTPATPGEVCKMLQRMKKGGGGTSTSPAEIIDLLKMLNGEATVRSSAEACALLKCLNQTKPILDLSDLLRFRALLARYTPDEWMVFPGKLKEVQAELKKALEKVCPAPDAHPQLRNTQQQLSAARARIKALSTPVCVPPGLQDFQKEVKAVLASAVPRGLIYYTTDGSDPEEGKCAGSGLTPLELTITETSTLRAMTVDEAGATSGTVSISFSKGTPPPAPKENCGLGMLLERHGKSEDLGGGVFIRGVLPGGPAALDARLQEGDEVLSVGGTSVKGLRLDTIQALITGLESSEVVVLCAPTARPVPLTLKRAYVADITSRHSLLAVARVVMLAGASSSGASPPVAIGVR